MKNVKNKILSSFVILITAIVMPTYVYAQENQSERNLILNYDGFFDRMEDLDEAEYQDIKLAFYFMNQSGDACPVKSVRLQTQLKEMEVYNLPSGEILLPFDHQLDADKAAIVIEKQDTQVCGLDMRLESVILLDKDVDVIKAKSLVATFDLALNDLAGVMSFTLPDVVGVTFKSETNDILTITNSQAGKCELNACTLTLTELALYQGQNQETINFSHSIIKAVPFIQ
jgi:hypothetical protein